MLAKIDGVCVVGEADNAPSAIQGILRTRPDSVVLDIKLIGGSGIEVLRRVRSVEPTINFIVLTNNADEQYRKVCMAAGANHFLDKASEFEKVKALVFRVRAAQAIEKRQGVIYGQGEQDGSPRARARRPAQ
jgi:DNA-binding NarL/FixJ family response regulator